VKNPLVAFSVFCQVRRASKSGFRDSGIPDKLDGSIVIQFSGIANGENPENWNYFENSFF